MKTISYALFIGLILLSVVSAKAGLQLDTKLSYMGPYIGYLGTEVGALAGLMDSNGHPVAGKTITYKLGFLPEVNEITDDDGIAIGKILIPFIMPEGFYVMSVIFKGDEEYGPSFDKVMFEVVKTETYTIKITSGEGGTTEPSGEVFVPAGSSIKIIITPNTGKEVDTVL